MARPQIGIEGRKRRKRQRQRERHHGRDPGSGHHAHKPLTPRACPRRRRALDARDPRSGGEGARAVDLRPPAGRHEARAPDLTFAIDATERVIQARGKRLSLESSSIPFVQFDILNALSVVLILAYAYLTQDKDLSPHLLGFGYDAAGHVACDPSFGVHVLFGFVCGALAVFNSLASDLNRPFHGDYKLESGTVIASIKQLRGGLAPHLGRNHIALSPKAKVRPSRSPSAGGEPIKFFA